MSDLVVAPWGSSSVPNISPTSNQPCPSLFQQPEPVRNQITRPRLFTLLYTKPPPFFRLKILATPHDYPCPDAALKSHEEKNSDKFHTTKLFYRL